MADRSSTRTRLFLSRRSRGAEEWVGGAVGWARGPRSAGTPVVSRKDAKAQRGGVVGWLLVAMLLVGGWALGTSFFFGHTGDHRFGTTLMQFATLKVRLDAFKLEYGRYPTQQEGLRALVAPPVKPNGNAPAPFIDEAVLTDPWGTPLEYHQPAPEGTCHFDLVSLGEDGKPGGEGPDADFSMVAVWRRP